MNIFMKPVYGINYKAGYLYFLFRHEHPLIPGVSWIPDDPAFQPWQQLDFFEVGLCTGQNRAIKADPKHGVSFCDLDPLFNDPQNGIIFRKPKKMEQKGEKPLLEEAIRFVGTTFDFKLFLTHSLAYSSLFKNILPEKIKNEFLRFFHTKGRNLSSEFIMHCLIRSSYSDSSLVKVTPQELFSDSCLKELKPCFPVKFQSFSTILP